MNVGAAPSGPELIKQFYKKGTFYILYKSVHKWLGPTNRTLTQKSYFIRENIKSEVVFYEKYDTVTFAKLLLSYFDTNL